LSAGGAGGAGGGGTGATASSGSAPTNGAAKFYQILKMESVSRVIR
jgi:hypothetical protein